MGLFDRFTKPVPIAKAILGGNITHVRKHIRAGLDVNKKIDGDRCYPIHYASHSYVEIIQLLIQNGADVNARDDNGKTPLHIASFVGYEPGVKLLLEHGADVNAKDHEGKTPLAEATLPTPLQAFGAAIGASPSPSELKEESNRMRVAQILKKHGGII